MAPKIYCLGVESTAHTFGVGIASSDLEILVDEKSIYKPPIGKGIHPRGAAQHHCSEAPKVLYQALIKFGYKPDLIDAIAFSLGPGLGPSLRTGATIARAIATWFDKPLIPVHHAIGHIELASLLTGAKDPLVLLVSGGHTTITAFVEGRWRIFGETEDITLGNLLDMFAREASLPSPGGLSIELFAKKGVEFIDLPYVVKGNDVSFSGILTAVKEKLHSNHKLEDICFSLQEVAFSMLTEAFERALAYTEKKEVLLVGGVAANKRLQQMIQEISKDHDSAFFVVPQKYSGDCGAQIAWTGVLAHQSGVSIDVEKSFVKSKWRLDEVSSPWRVK
jgi:N6-L-threonylcarbamoyladenine synthase